MPELVRDVVNGECHQGYIKCFEQRINYPNVNVHATDEKLEEEL